MEKLRKIVSALINPETILYLVFGVLTTAVNIGLYGLLREALHWPLMLSNTLAWVASVLFAFLTNKTLVFRSKSFALKLFLFELVSFFGARLLSLGVDMVGMWLCLDVIQMHSLLAKIIVNFFVILINYILSKLIIFSKKHEPNRGG